MGALAGLVLGLALLLGSDGTGTTPTDLPRLRELLRDKQHPQGQSQAALLLVRDRSAEAEALVRQGLRQTESADVFVALAAAVRLQQDTRFVDELLAALAKSQAGTRQAAAEALSAVAHDAVIGRLQGLATDSRADYSLRRAALWVLGHTGSKSAAGILIELLASPEEGIRHAAADALTEMTGCPYGIDLPRWRLWWQHHKDLTPERWLEERVAYQSLRAQRLAADLQRAQAEVVRLHQQLYSRSPPAERLGYVQVLVKQEDPALRVLAVNGAVELLPSADALGQHTLAESLLHLSADGSEEVQRAAALALGRVSDPRAFERLRDLMAQGTTAVRAAAARALAQQARSKGPEAQERQQQVMALLQKALDDPALPVVIEAAEDLGTLGVPEAGPILAALLRHPSGPVRQTAAQALERVAEVPVLDGLLEGLADTAVPVRFSLVGAIGHAVGDGRALGEAQRRGLLLRLQELLEHDADPGVRSRAATVLGDCGPSSVLPVLWQGVTATEDSRVQEKAWAALVEVLARAGSLDLLREWQSRLQEAKQGQRRLQLLGEVYARWQRQEAMRPALAAVMELLVEAQLEQGKWSAAFPLVRELLARPATEPETDQRLRWLLRVGEQALQEGNGPEALRVVQEAQAFLTGRPAWASEFARLEKRARPASGGREPPDSSSRGFTPPVRRKAVAARLQRPYDGPAAARPSPGKRLLES
jgi:HEAT repeat protein